MKTIRIIPILAVLGLLITSGQGTALAADAAQPGWYTAIVDIGFVEPYAAIPIRDDAVIIDSRPTARKYDIAHLPTAISIPDRKFDQMTSLLPEDKDKLLIFYCGGLKCMLSHNSAFKAEKLGYTNVKVYAAGYPDWIKSGNIGSVSAAYVKKLIDTKAKVVIIDARPQARKYDKGHVPTAISIPDRKFDKMTELLPADKDTPLIFYCGGFKCKLSPNSAAKAVKLGYTNVKLFQAGYPEWVKQYGPGPMASGEGAPAKVAIDTGSEPDTITFASFEKIILQAPGSVYLIDVRSPEEFKMGSIKGAINMTVDEVEEKVAELPSDKPIIFFCSTGARSGEAYDIVKMEREGLEVYFLDANVTHAKDGTYKLEPAV